MTYWDWIRIANLTVLAALLVTAVLRYRTGARTVDPRNLLDDPSHMQLLRMGLILLYLALIEGYAEGLITNLPGGPRVIAPLPGLLLILLSAHWRRAHRAGQALRRRLPTSTRSPR